MTLFVDRLPERNARDIFEFEASPTEAAGAAFDQAIFENPTTALRRMDELADADYGRTVYAPGTQGSVSSRIDPDTPLLSADDARARIAESGLDLKVPDTGMRQGVLDILMSRKREELQRQVVMASAPRSAAPLQILAGFAASAIDPINIAAAFVPVVGEARYTAMLARAGGAAGRFGVRAGVGAAEGAVGAAMVEPLILAASSQDQSDYDMADSLANIAFGSILGGGLHSLGGAAADALRSRAARMAAGELPESAHAVDATAPIADELAPTRRSAIDLLDDSPESIQALTARQMEQDIASTADASARSAVLDDLRAELEPIAAGRVPSVADLKAEQLQIEQRLQSLDDTFTDRAKEFHAQKMKRKEAEKAAREVIEQDRADLSERLQNIENRLNENRTQERARAELSQIRKGQVPDNYRDRVKSRAEEIRAGIQKKPLAQSIRAARDVVADAGHSVRVAALRAGIAQAMQGRPVDVADLFRLANEPEKSMEAIKSKPRQFDREGEAVSKRADESIKSAGDDDAAILKAAADDEQMALEVAEQTGLKPDLAEANALAKEAQTYSKAWRALAVCSLRS